MQRRLVPSFAIAGLSALVLGALLLAGVKSGAAPVPGRIPFQIATGGSSGTFFAVGEVIAGLVSHPPGVSRCDTASACGPAGLIATARTSGGAVDNLAAVDSGAVESGLVQGDVVAAAVQGRYAFRRGGKLKHVRVIASLFSEQLHLVVAAKSKIHGVADLRGKRVSLGTASSGLGITAQEVLDAWRVTGVKPVHADLFAAIRLMQQGKLDAFFVVGGAPLAALSDVLTSGTARLVPLDGPGRAQLLKQVPSLTAAVIAAGVYGSNPAVDTVASRALWIVRDSVPDTLVYGVTRALFSPANRAALAASHPSARQIGLATAALALPAPLHTGAARFYREQGLVRQ